MQVLIRVSFFISIFPWNLKSILIFQFSFAFGFLQPKAFPCLWQASFLFKAHLPSSLLSKTLKSSRYEHKNYFTPNSAHPFTNPTSNQNIQLMRGIVQLISAERDQAAQLFHSPPLWLRNQPSGSANAEGNSTSTLKADLVSGKLLKIHLNCDLQFSLP